MAISDKDRRILWAKSGNMCAICKIELVKSNKNKEVYNIGEECHIVSSKPSGPRYEPNWKDYDVYSNLILLCRNHHKTIDDVNNISLYPKEKLEVIKQEHEKWVKGKLSETSRPDNLYLISTGTELASIIAGTYGTEKSNDQLERLEDAEYVGSIWQTLSDYCDISTDLEPYQKTMVEYELNELIKEMMQKGFLIYANRYMKTIKFADGTSSKWPIACIYIKRYSPPTP